MVLGIGVDLCSIERMAICCQREAFMKRVFTEEERRCPPSGTRAIARFAGAFAAKEAFAKASGMGLGKVGLQNLSVLHDQTGKPQLAICWENERLCRFRHCRIHLSISHDGPYAVAMVLIEE